MRHAWKLLCTLWELLIAFHCQRRLELLHAVASMPPNSLVGTSSMAMVMHACCASANGAAAKWCRRNVVFTLCCHKPLAAPTPLHPSRSRPRSPTCRRNHLISEKPWCCQEGLSTITLPAPPWCALAPLNEIFTAYNAARMRRSALLHLHATSPPCHHACSGVLHPPTPPNSQTLPPLSL